MKIRLLRYVALVLMLPLVALASRGKGKDHPLTGTVASFYAPIDAGGHLEDGDTYERRVYALKTDTDTLEIIGYDTHGARKRPPLTIGQILRFRTDQKFIYTVLDDGKEHRYYIRSAK